MFVEEDFDFGFIQEKNKQTFIVSFRFVSSLFLSFSFVSFRKAFGFVSQSFVSFRFVSQSTVSHVRSTSTI